MIFIKAIDIKNFQSHENTHIEFDRGLNVIVGRSDSGKTAIIRAIKWVFYNDPPPGNLIRLGTKEMSVSIEFNTGAKVTRLWSNKENKYILIKANGEEIELEKFNRSVPHEVIEEINIQKVELGTSIKNGINISEQLEGPFLLTESSSTRASAIGRLIGVNFIDDALRDLIKDTKNNSKRLKEFEIEKQNIEDELKKYEYLDAEEKKLLHLKTSRKLINNYLEKLSRLKKLNLEYKAINCELEKLHFELHKFSFLSQLEKKLELLQSNTIRLNRYKSISNNFNSTIKEIENIKENLILLSNLNEVQYNFEKLNNLIQNYIKISKLKSNLNEITNRIDNGEKYIISLNNLELNTEKYQKLDNLVILFHKLNSINFKNINLNLEINNYIKEIKNYQEDLFEMTKKYEELFIEIGYCPLCHSKIDKSTISEHLRGEI